MNWLHYLLEANLYLGVFYVAYCLFLNKETYYQLNRIYLVCSCVIAFVLPVLQLGILIPPPPPTPPATYMAVQQATGMPIAAAAAPIMQQHFTWQDALWYIYLAGAIIFLILFIIKLFSLVKLIIGKPMLKHADYNLIYINESHTAFSFFNYLFIGNNAPDKNIIMRHELVHIQQKHSADIIFLEILKVINWFNPLVYLLQNSLKTVHEYLADEKSVDNKDDALAYSSFLVNNAYGLTGPSIAHSFFTYNLLKKRIIMLNQQRSGNLARLKYLVAVPIGAGLLFASTLSFSKTYGWIDLAPRAVKSSLEPELREAPPLVIEKAYLGLMEYVIKNIKYTNSDSKKSGITLINFTIATNNKIKDVKVSDNPKVTGSSMPQNLLELISSYPGLIYDKPGKYLLEVVVGLNNVAHISEAFRKMPGYAGAIVLNVPPEPPKDNNRIIQLPPPKPKVDQVKFPPAVPADFQPEKTSTTSKGYKVEEGRYTTGNNTYYIAMITAPPGKKLLFTNDKAHKRMVVYKNRDNARGEKMIYEKFGYKFPDVKVTAFVDQVRFPPPLVKPDKVITDGFTRYLAKNIRYPAEARENNIRGHIIAEFKIDETRHLTDPRIISGIGHGCDEEVLRVLKAYTDKSYAKGTFIMAITFDLGYDNDDKNAMPPLEPLNNSIKTAPNYAGEVFITAYATRK